jgi:uncharacterized membrane protein YdcZ (DUF606 family)
MQHNYATQSSIAGSSASSQSLANSQLKLLTQALYATVTTCTCGCVEFLCLAVACSVKQRLAAVSECVPFIDVLLAEVFATIETGTERCASLQGFYAVLLL